MVIFIYQGQRGAFALVVRRLFELAPIATDGKLPRPSELRSCFVIDYLVLCSQISCDSI